MYVNWSFELFILCVTDDVTPGKLFSNPKRIFILYFWREDV